MQKKVKGDNLLIYLIYLMFLLLLVFFFIPATEARAEDGIMHLPDRQLETAVRSALGRPTGVLTTSHLLELTTLEASRYDIHDLTGLEKAVNLESLSLHGNRVENLAPLANLGSLRSLNLNHNRVSNLTPLSGLKELETLYLGGNRISNLSPLASLSGLGQLHLFGNRIEQISPLAALQNLKSLNLNDNNISNFTPLQGTAKSLEQLSIRGNRYRETSFLKPFAALEYLELGNSALEGIEELGTLTRLTHLQITGSKISDLKALAPLLSLRWLSLDNNRVSDLTPLGKLAGLEYLSLKGNSIREIDTLAKLDKLAWLELDNNLLEVEGDSPEMKIIRELLQREVTVSYERQLIPRYRGDGSVYIRGKASGQLFRSSPQNYFTVLNHNRGWRIQSFTVEHQGAKPRDYIREIGRYDLGTGHFAWYATPGRLQPNVDAPSPYQVTYKNPVSIQLALGIQTLPGSGDDEERLFYLAQVTLYNIHTQGLYTIKMEPPKMEPPAKGDGGQATEEKEETGRLRVLAID